MQTFKTWDGIEKQVWRIKIRKSKKDEWKFVSGFHEHVFGIIWLTTKDKSKAMRTVCPDYICSAGSNKFYFDWEKWE